MRNVMNRMSKANLVFSIALVYVVAVLCCALMVWLELSMLAVINLDIVCKYVAAAGVLLVASVLEHCVVEQRLYMVTHIAFATATIVGFVVGIAPVCNVAKSSGSIVFYVIAISLITIAHALLILLLILMDALVASYKLKIGG